MKRLAVITFVFVSILLTVTAINIVSALGEIGVKSGDYFEYVFTNEVNGATLTTRYRITITAVAAPHISALYKDLTSGTEKIIDVDMDDCSVSGDIPASGIFLMIPGKLSPGDTITIEYREYVMQGPSTRLDRDALYATGEGGEMFFDKTTGVLLENIIYTGYSNIKISLEKTNLWGNQPTPTQPPTEQPTPTQPPTVQPTAAQQANTVLSISIESLYILIGIVAVVIIIAVVATVMIKKKKS